MRRAVIAAILMAITAGPALAVPITITQTQPFSGIPNYQSDLTFNQFDDQGGTLSLLSVEVIVTLNVDGGQLVLDNDGIDPATGTFEFGAKGNISSVDVALLNALSQPVTSEVSAIHSGGFNLAGNVGDVPNDFDPSPPDGMQYDGGPETDGDSGFIGSAYYAGYIGMGTFDVKASIAQWADFGGVSGIEWAVTPVTSSGTVQVIYTIPEPATMMLLVSGGAVALMRRKRQA